MVLKNSFPALSRAFGLVITLFILCSHYAGAVPIPPKAELASGDMQVFLSSHDKIWDCILPLDDGRFILQAPSWLGNTQGQLYLLSKDKKLSLWPNKDMNQPTSPQAKQQAFIGVAGITKTQDGHIWVLDSGVAMRGQPPASLPRIFEINPQDNHIIRQFTIDANALEKGSILNGIAVWKNHVFAADSGVAGLVFLDTNTSISKRYLAHNFLLTAVHPLQGQNGVVTNVKGQPVALDVSMLAISPDGKALFMQAPTGRLIRVVTSVLLDPQISPTELEEGLTGWYITPHLGGMVIDKFGTLYWSDVSSGSIISYTKGRIPHRLITDPRLQWPTTPGISKDGHLYVTASQVDRSDAFGKPSTVEWPINIYDFQIPQDSFNR